MNNTPNPDNTELGEILHKLTMIAFNEGKSYPNHTGVSQDVETAKRQINALITKARVDELKRYSDVPFSVGGMQRNSYLIDRLAELDQKIKENL